MCIVYSPTVLSTSTHCLLHCLLLLTIIYRLIHTSPRSNNKKYVLVKESCQTRIDLRDGSLFAEFVGPDNCFIGTISLKDLVFIPLLNTLNILLHIYNRKLCARPGAWTFWHEQVPSPPSIQMLAQLISEMFILIHLSTFSACLWLMKKRLCAQWENRVIDLVMIHYHWIFSHDIEPTG